MLIGKGGKAAGDFSLYTNKCDLFKAGWKMFRPELYEFSLVDPGSAPTDSDLADLNKLEECEAHLSG